MKKYVDEQMLFCVKQNNIYPQIIDINKNLSVVFGKIGLTIEKYNKCSFTSKRTNYWQDKTAEEINAELNDQEWIKDV